MPVHDLQTLSDEQLFHRLRLHRRRGEHACAKAAWDQLVENVYDRVRTRVATWRWPGKDVRIPAADVEDVTQLAILRLGGIDERFEGVALPQFRAFALSCAVNACMDWSRKEMRREMGIAGHLEDRAPGGEEPYGRFARQLGELAQRAAEREAEKLEASHAFARALARVPSADQRAVVRMTLDGMPAEEIARRLGTSLDNVYQLRRRGQRKLKEVLGEGLG